MIRVLFTVALFAGSIAIFVLYTKPAYDSVRSVQVQMAEYDSALSKADELQRLKQQLLSRYNAFNPVDIDRLRKLLPDHVDNVRLVLDLDTLATKHGFALQNVIIDAQGLSPLNSSEVAVIGADRNSFDSLTLKFGTSGSYPKFVELMQALENSLRIVDMIELTIDPDLGPSLTGETLYRFDVTLRTYWLK
jgi:hypothetical protein